MTALSGIRGVLVILAAYAMLLLGCTTLLWLFAKGKIERQLSALTQESLAEHFAKTEHPVNFAKLKIAFDERDGRVSGEIPDMDAFRALDGLLTKVNLQEIEALKGKVASLTKGGVTLPAKCHLAKVDGRYLARCFLPKVTQNDIQSAFEQVDPEMEVEFVLPEHPDPEEFASTPGWAVPLGDFLQSNVEGIRDLNLNLSGEEIFTLEGKVDSEVERDRIVNAAHQSFPRMRDVMNIDLLVEPSIAASTLFLHTDAEGEVTVEGMVSSEEIRQSLLSAIQDARQPYQTINSKLEASSHVTQSDWAASVAHFSKHFFAKVAFPQLSIDADRAILSGQVADAGTAAEIKEMATDYFVGRHVELQLTDSTKINDSLDEEANIIHAISSTDIYFDSGSNEISLMEVPKLERLAGLLREATHIDLIIVGYADPSGDPALNLALSKKRCLSVKNQLQSLGISPERLDINEKGAAASVGDTPLTPEAKKQMRRVEFEIIQVNLSPNTTAP